MTQWKIGDRVESEAAESQGPAKARSPIERRRWCLVNTERFREDDAGKRIAELGFVVYCPKFKIEVRDPKKHRARKLVERPLFNSYTFAAIAPQIDSWRSIEHVRGVIGVVRAGDQPGHISQREMDRIRCGEADNFGIELRPGVAVRSGAEVVRGFAEGERLRVTDGPFQDQIVLFVRQLGSLDVEGRIVALLDLFGRRTSIEFDFNQVERED